MAFIGQSEEIREYQGRYFYLKSFVVVSFFILFIRIWYLQILNGERFYVYSKQNSLKQEKIPASRGIILDRNREILVDNYPSFDIIWTPQYVVQPEKTERLLQSLLKISKEELRDILEKEAKAPRFQPRVIKHDVSREEVALIEAHRFDLPGIDIEVEIKRVYHQGPIGAHLLGYIGEVSSRELEILNRRSFQKYSQRDFVGKFGIEERWEDYLRGIDGAFYSEVDALGRKTSEGLTLFDYEQIQKDPIPGKNLVLTMDSELQLAVAQSLRDKKGNPKAGAVVALDPNTGEVLAMVSQPGFDPTHFSRGIDYKEWDSLLANVNKPLLDKTIQDVYPPGSTFKTVTALAGLASGLIDPKETIHCNGHFFLERGHYRCWTWRNGGHGVVNFKRAIKESCDTYFYKVGVKVGVDTLAKYAMMYGLGSKTGIALRGEEEGTVPTTDWKLKRFKEKWYQGETPPVAIGQGYLAVSVLQLVRLYMAIANGGTLYVPYVVKRIEEPNGNLIQEFGPQVIKTSPLATEVWKQLKEGLYAVVNEPGGTAYYSARSEGLDIAGKTGTSQIIRISKADREKKCEELQYPYRDHGWFVGFAPIHDPQIVVIALGLHDCHPYSGASMVVRDVIKAYLKNRIEQKDGKGKKPGA